MHLQRLAKHWNVSARVCIRNWRSPKDQALWDEAAREYHLECVQHAPTTRGKNASDVELVVRAMDLYHGLGYRAFCILSADTDFLPLVHRLKRGGCDVTLSPLVPPEVASSESKTGQAKESAATEPKKKLTTEPQKQPKPGGFAKTVRKALQACRDAGHHESGWVDIARIGQQIPGDKTKETFGYGKSKTLHSVIDSLPGLAVRKNDGKYQVSLAPS